MLSFESSTSAVAPEGKLFFLGALAGAARAGAGIARAGAVKGGSARAGAARAGKSSGGITISPRNEKSENKSTTTVNNDYSTVNYK